MDGHPAAPLLKIRLLGSFEVQVAGRTIEDAEWQRRNARQLIKLLAVQPQHRLHRDMVIEYLWPESSASSAANNLNKVLHIARRVLEPELAPGVKSRFLHRSGDMLELLSPGGIATDVEEFESASVSALDGKNLQLLIECAELYTGDLLADDRYEDQFSARRESLQRTQHQVLLAIAEQAVIENRLEHGIDALIKLTLAEPLNEDYHRRLMSLYAWNNQRSKALSQFEVCQGILMDELGVAPDEQTLALYQTIQNPESGTLSNLEKSNSADSNTPKALDSDCLVLAVLPLENTAHNPEIDYLCDGITENLIYCLSRIPGHRVMASSTVFRYKNQPVNPTDLREQLSVDGVVLGRVTCLPDRIRVWVEVVDTEDGLLQWGQHYDQAMDDIVHLQHDIAKDVLDYYRTQTEGEVFSKHQLPVVSASAYHHYLKGRYHWNKRTGTSLEAALAHFQTAIGQDPVYAPSYSGLADTYNLLSLYTSAAPNSTMPKAAAAARQALAIDPDSPEAHTSLAYYYVSYEWDWRRAEQAFTRALQLDPNYATARQWLHKLYVATSRFSEARAQIELAKKLDPLSLMIATEEAWGLYYSRQYTDALNHLETVLVDDPHFAMAHYILGLIYLQTDEPKAAITRLQAANEQQRYDSPFLLQIGTLGHALALTGQTDAAVQQLSYLDRQDAHSGTAAYARALIYAGMGDDVNLMKALESAFEARVDRLIFLAVDPLFDPWRNHPHWQKLSSRLLKSPDCSDILPDPAGEA
ncbi:MAG: tetratricopeptide repeat protein [Granulosicoccus sp.]|nr:tetratricopeptide repeat protein [Granulosicoccus sp.]